MGNSSTWAHYDDLEEARLREQFWDLPRRVPDDRWVAMVDKIFDGEEGRRLDAALSSKDGTVREMPSRAKVRSDIAEERAFYLNEEIVPLEDGQRNLDGVEPARMVIAYVAAECAARRLRTYDIIHDLWCDSAIDTYLRPDERRPARETWARFLEAIGYPEPIDPLPWWVAAAYPDSHYRALIPAERARSIAREIRAHRLDELAADMLEKPICDVLAFIAEAGAANRAVLAIESAS